MNQTEIDEFLAHYGVRGMHWGIRNKKKRAPSHDYKLTQPYRGRKVHELTNRQLKVVNERMNLEQNYARMNQSRVDSGHAAVKKFLAMGTTAVGVYGLFQTPFGKVLIANGKKAIQPALRTAKILKVVK